MQIHAIYLTKIYGAYTHIYMPYMIIGINYLTGSTVYLTSVNKIWLTHCKYRSYSHYTKWAYRPESFAYMSQSTSNCIMCFI